MSENIYLILFGVICFFLLFLFYIATHFIRDKIFHSKKYLLNFLILVEYLLLGYVIISAITLPYQLNGNGLFGKLSISRVKLDDNIYEALILIFILISLTSFNSIRLSLKESARSYLLFVAISALAVIVLYQVNHYWFSLEKTDSDGFTFYADTKQKQLNEIFISILPSVIWLYFISRFKADNTTIFKNYFYNGLPIVVWYLVFTLIIIKPFLLSKQEVDHLLNVLGAFG